MSRPASSSASVIVNGGAMRKIPPIQGGLDLLSGDHGGHRQTRAQGLRQCQQVWDDPDPLMLIHQSGATDSGLCLVDDQQHVALDAEFLEPAQVPERPTSLTTSSPPAVY
jgi:hypothetical protein